MKKTILLSVFIFICAFILNAQSNNWNYMGTVFASYGDPDGYRTESSVTAELYSSFDGEKIQYKLIVGGEVYTAVRNPDFSQSEYDAYRRRVDRDDNYRGVHLKNKRCYPFCAGKYRFNPAHARK